MQSYEAALTKAIEALRGGDIRALRTVYSAFAEKDPERITEAAHAVREALQGYSTSQMVKLYKRFRDFTSMEWLIDWSRVSLHPVRKWMSREEWRYFLILGTFHPNGYFRQRCMRELGSLPGMLPYLLLRANDWVVSVREEAFLMLDEYVEQCSAAELVEAMPALEKLEGASRRSHQSMEALKVRIEEKLLQGITDISPSSLKNYEYPVRRALYRMLLYRKLLTPEQIDAYMESEKLSCGKELLIRGILSHPDCTLQRAEPYLRHKNAVIRRRALEYKYGQLGTCWDGLEEMLMDANRGVREYASYILEKHSDLDIRGYYLAHLSDEEPEYAILGLSEYSRQGNVEVLLPGLSSPRRKAVKCTLLALERQEDFQNEELLWDYLADERAEIAKAAYLSIRRKDFYMGAERIYQAYCGSKQEHTKHYLLKLLLHESSWDRLPYLILLYERELPKTERQLIEAGIRSRYMYGKLTAPKRERILSALEQKQDDLPEGLEAEILYDMKFL